MYKRHVTKVDLGLEKFWNAYENTSETKYTPSININVEKRLEEVINRK